MPRPSLPSGRVVVLLALSALALMTIDSRGFALIDRARVAALSISGPIRDGVGFIASPVVDGYHGAVHYDQVVEENAALRAEVADLEGRIDQLPDLQNELDEVRAATDIDFLDDYPTVTARVITDRRTGLERIIEINVGSNDGIEVGFPVVTGRGLVGTTDQVYGDRSTIRLVTDPSMFVGVRALASGAVGVIQGDGAGRNVSLDLAEAGLSDVAGGTRFVTSGSNGSRFPLGIPVGRAVAPGADSNVEAPSQLETSAQLDLIIYVSVVILPPEPADDELPLTAATENQLTEEPLAEDGATDG